MALARFQFTVTDEAGNIVPSAYVEVRNELTGATLATLYSDRDGSSPISNPMQSDAEGFAAFHVTGGAYKITAYKNSFERIWRYVGIGTSQETDFGTIFNPRGAWADGSPAEAYSLGDVVSHSVVGSDVYAFVSNVDSNDGNEPQFTGSPLVPTSDAFWTVLGLIEAPGTPGADGAIGLSGGIHLVWNTATSGDPGAGKVRGNHATPSSITSIAIDELDDEGVNIDDLLQVLDNSTSGVKASILVIDQADAGNWLSLSLTAAFVDATGYWTGAVTYVDHGGTLANDAAVSVFVSRTGDKGDTGAGSVFAVRADDGTITVDPTADDHILCEAGACTVNLPASALREQGRGYLIVDYAGDAATNTKTVVPNGSETIAGLDEWLINMQGDRLRIFPRPDDNGWYLG
jgi:hypothetical protein